MKPITVLSLFDGMSCGQIALERAGIPVAAYYASEIDKWAIQTTQKNYPNTIQLGTIEDWRKWNIPTPDLILAGSPCQGFSVAGHKLNFDDPRSKLFFTFCDILAWYSGINPDLKFLLENVKMKKVWQEVITDRMKVEPVLINSALVSAQNRERLYWANFPITQPEDKGILLKDIVESGFVDRDKSFTIDANYWKGGNPKAYFVKNRRQLVFSHQSQRRAMVQEVAALTERRTEEAKQIRREYRAKYGKDFSPRRAKEVVARTDGKANCVTTGMGIEHTLCIRVGSADDIRGHDYNKRVYSTDGKSPSLAAKSGGNLEPKIALDDVHYRKLTPLECERLQTVPERFTEGVSNTQRYRMLGNGWCVDVIVGILKSFQETCK